MVLQQVEDKKRLVLIDGHAILHRAYHALPPLSTRSGELVNAVYGFCSMLLKVVEDLKPQYLAIAFDTPKPTFRKQEFVGYQAKRPRMDSELVGQIEKVKSLVAAFGIPAYEAPGFEADDVIGTLSRLARGTKKGGQSMETVIVTGDRDLFQLVGKKVKLYMPVHGLSETKIFDEKEVKQKMGIGPEKIVDYKGLVGDPSDNYPGVPGIGPKGAIDLIEKFGSVEKIYQSLGKIESLSLVNKLKAGEKSAYLSKKLARVVTNVPIKLDLKKAKLKDFNQEEVLAVLKELGFKSLVARITGGAKEEKKKKSKTEAGEQKTLF